MKLLVGSKPIYLILNFDITIIRINFTNNSIANEFYYVHALMGKTIFIKKSKIKNQIFITYFPWLIIMCKKFHVDSITMFIKIRFRFSYVKNYGETLGKVKALFTFHIHLSCSLNGVVSNFIFFSKKSNGPFWSSLKKNLKFGALPNMTILMWRWDIFRLSVIHLPFEEHMYKNKKKM